MRISISLFVLMLLASTQAIGQTSPSRLNNIISCMVRDSCKVQTTTNSPGGKTASIILPVVINSEKQETIVLRIDSIAAREFTVESGLISFVTDSDFDGVIDYVHVISADGKTVMHMPARLMTQEEKIGFQKYFDSSIYRALTVGLTGPDGRGI